MWESVVARLTAGTLPTNDTGLAWALPTLWAAVMADSPRGVALTGQCTLVVKGHQGPGRVLAESGGCLGAVETNQLMVLSQEVRPETVPPSLPIYPPSRGCGEGLWPWSLGENGRTTHPWTHN